MVVERERVVTPERREDDAPERSLRPTRLSEFIGQDLLRDNLRYLAKAAFELRALADDFVEIIVISTFFIFLRLHIGCAFTRRLLIGCHGGKLEMSWINGIRKRHFPCVSYSRQRGC